ncbi:hypothetical protein [Caballeronia sp. DA-9]|uniref:hypothetical protein n=1 Tax=Caballeronia sp. DA-9 TaxID=3436237 RepID=UPI003F67FD26
MADQQRHDADALLERMNVPRDLRGQITNDILKNRLIVPIEEPRRRDPPPGSMEMLVGYDPTARRAPRLNLTTLRGVNAFGLMSSAIAAFTGASLGEPPLGAVAAVLTLISNLDVKTRLDNLTPREAAVLVVSNDLNNEPVQWPDWLERSNTLLQQWQVTPMTTEDLRKTVALLERRGCRVIDDEDGLVVRTLYIALRLG